MMVHYNVTDNIFLLTLKIQMLSHTHYPRGFVRYDYTDSNNYIIERKNRNIEKKICNDCC